MTKARRGERRWRWWEAAALLILVLVAAYLRMGNPGVVEFKRDEAALSLVALDFVRTGDLPLLGITSSVGIPNAPFNAYILAIPYAISSSPIVATQFVGLINVLAVGMSYTFLRRYVQPLSALLAVGAFAVSPWAVIFSRKIWAQDMLPLFVVLVFIAGVLGFLERQRWGQFLFLPLLAITGQIHYGAFIILPAALYLLWHGRRHLTWAFWAGLGVAFLLTLPYLIGLFRAELFNADVLRNALSGSEAPSAQATGVFSIKVLREAALLFSGVEMHALAGPERFEDFLATIPDIAYPLFYLVAVWVGVSVVWLAYAGFVRRGKRCQLDQTVVIGIVFPIVIYIINWTPFYIHYLIPIIPLGFWAGALALNDIWRQHAQQGRGVVVTSATQTTITFLGIIIFSLQFTSSVQLLHFLKNEWTPGGFAVPLHYLTQLETEVRQQGTDNIIIEDTKQLLPPSVWEVLFIETREKLRYTNQENQVFPQEDAIRLRTVCNSTVQRHTFRSVEEGCYTTHGYTPEQQELAQHNLNAQFKDSVQLRGYTWNDKCLELVWQLKTQPERDYMFSVHAFDEHDTRIGIADSISWPSAYWVSGDTIRKTFCFTEMDVEENIASIKVGMYHFEAAQIQTITTSDDRTTIEIDVQ